MVSASKRCDKDQPAIRLSPEERIAECFMASLRFCDRSRSSSLIDSLDETEIPYAPIRWVNHWDNLDGSIERGYGGRSIFWDNGHARADLSRVSDYGRLLASLGINTCSINNVNADPRILAADMLPEIARIAAAFRPWGVRVALSADFSSPKTLGGLDTFDPLDSRVAAWWSAKVDELYRAVPDLAGIIIKADSEGRAGPSAYGTDARGCGERGGSRAEASRRPAFLPGLRLRPPHGLAEPQE